MARAVNVHTHPDFTIDEIVAFTGCHIPNAAYKESMRQALDYFQRVVPRSVLRQPDNAGPWGLRINGTTITLLSWLQAIDFHHPVNPRRLVIKGNPLIAFRYRPSRLGYEFGNWYTFPSTKQAGVAIPSSQTRLHKFKARTNFTCLQSTASDAFVGWARDLPAEYRAGGAQQLFIWNARSLLEPA
jgi:hypothetical protein